eukprot:6587755-Karenia_brevis.AAC.1
MHINTAQSLEPWIFWSLEFGSYGVVMLWNFQWLSFSDAVVTVHAAKCMPMGYCHLQWSQYITISVATAIGESFLCFASTDAETLV